jgi:hypothetical protein
MRIISRIMQVLRGDLQLVTDPLQATLICPAINSLQCHEEQLSIGDKKARFWYVSL